MRHSENQPRLKLDREPRRIVIFRALYVGDFLVAVPALRAVRQRFPHAEITLIGLPWNRALAARFSHYIDHFVEFPGYPGLPEVATTWERTEQFFQEQRAQQYDLAIQLHGDGHISNGVVTNLRARYSIGFGPADVQGLSLRLAYEDDEHEIRRWLRLVATLGIHNADEQIEFPIQSHEAEQARQLLAAAPPLPGPLIGLHTGSKEEPQRWPAPLFAALADALVERYQARIVLTGTQAEQAITASVARRMSYPALDLAGQTDFGTFAALIGQLDLLVTNDTSASHFASASRTRSIILVGPDSVARWGPLNRDLHWPLDAKVLVDAAIPMADKLNHLPVAVVFDACVRALG